MVEKDSIKEAEPHMGLPASSEQSLTLQALQKEIEYHRQHDKNGSYLEKAVAYVHDVSSTDIAKLELDYKAESEKPNSITREQVIKDVTADQKALGLQDSIGGVTSAVANLFLATAGKRWSVLAAGITTALDTMHPNDSFGQQMMEGVVGLGLGYGAGRAAKYGFSMENKLLGKGLGYTVFPVVRELSHGGWPNSGYGEKPAIDKLFSTASDVSPSGTLPPQGGAEAIPLPKPGHGAEAPPMPPDSTPDTNQVPAKAINNDEYWKQIQQNNRAG